MSQDKWLSHIWQVPESKCKTHTIPFSPKLSLHSPASHTFAAQSWPLLCLVIPYTSYSLAATSWHTRLLCLGCRTPKQKGRFSPTSQFYQMHLLQLSPRIKAWYIQGGFIPGTQLMDYHQQCTLSVHLHTSHRDVGSQEIHFQLCTSIFPSATSTDMKNPLAQG